jgi:hypothetical protein
MMGLMVPRTQNGQIVDMICSALRERLDVMNMQMPSLLTPLPQLINV